MRLVSHTGIDPTARPMPSPQSAASSIGRGCRPPWAAWLNPDTAPSIVTDDVNAVPLPPTDVWLGAVGGAGSSIGLGRDW